MPSTVKNYRISVHVSFSKDRPQPRHFFFLMVHVNWPNRVHTWQFHCYTVLKITATTLAGTFNFGSTRISGMGLMSSTSWWKLTSTFKWSRAIARNRTSHVNWRIWQMRQNKQNHNINAHVKYTNIFLPRRNSKMEATNPFEVNTESHAKHN